MPTKPDNYTAILSIHGIGRHRRYANAGALLTALEKVAIKDSGYGIETLIEMKPRLEPPRSKGLSSDVPMMEVKRARRHKGKLYPAAKYRIYEVNWSPDTKVGMSTWSMLKWSSRLIRLTLRRNPKNWLLWPQIRLARLRKVSMDLNIEPKLRHALAVLSSGYRKYRGSLGTRYRDSDRQNPSFDNFLQFSALQSAGATTSEYLTQAAARWKSIELPCEARARATGSVLLWGTVVSLAAIFCLIYIISIGGLTQFQLNSAVVVFLILAVAGIFFRSFLTTVFSDVRYWSTLDENEHGSEARVSIKNRAISTLEHLASDPSCGRVIIVSHSLGTAIAYDALREIGLRNQARVDEQESWMHIKKVDCLITMGSPIDKLTLLFETTAGQSFREEIMREELRGNLTTMPFWFGDRQRIKWINFWDEIDPVSDPLYTPLGAKPIGDKFLPTKIENIKSENTRYYTPAKSHCSYLDNPAVATRIYNEIFRPESEIACERIEVSAVRRAPLVALQLIPVLILSLLATGSFYAALYNLFLLKLLITLCAVLVITFVVRNFLPKARCAVAIARFKSSPSEDREDDFPF